MPDPIIISPAGFIAEYNWPSYPLRGIGQAPSTVALAQKAGGSIIARGVGETDLVQPIGGAQGTLDIQVVTPGTGNLAVAFLVDNAMTPHAYCGISLDASVRPVVTITDVNGTVVAHNTSSAVAGVIGSPVSIHLTWSASTAISGARFVELLVNGIAITSGDWSTNPITAWVPFTPKALLLGTGNLGSFADFTPTHGITLVQLGPSVSL